MLCEKNELTFSLFSQQNVEILSILLWRRKLWNVDDSEFMLQYSRNEMSCEIVSSKTNLSKQSALLECWIWIDISRSQLNLRFQIKRCSVTTSERIPIDSTDLILGCIRTEN